MKRLENVLSDMDRFIDQHVLEDFIARGWVCPVRDETDYIFDDIDVSRIYLICELHIDMKFEDDAVDIILSLMDQLYDSRARLDKITKALKNQPNAIQTEILANIAKDI